MTDSDGVAWLDGDAARAFAGDAAITPVVTGEVNYASLDGLVRLCVELARLDGTQDATPAEPRDGSGAAPFLAREALERAIIGKTINFLLHSKPPFDLLEDLSPRRGAT